VSAYPLAIEIPLAVGVPVCAGDTTALCLHRGPDGWTIHDGGYALGPMFSCSLRVDLSTHLGFAHALRWFALHNRGVGVRAASWIDRLAVALAFDDVSRYDVLDLDAACGELAAAPRASWLSPPEVR
tara:strand:+ start:284 stop:664 length:381 start_codon:yes stop_codon:yes gene_type:complete